jgi:Right handed beta helix region
VLPASRLADGGSLTIAESRIAASVGGGVIALNGSRVSILHSTIEKNLGLAVDARGEGLELHRSIVLENVAGGVSGLGGTYDITNNFICKNGNDETGEFGGLRLDTTLPGNRVEHNTIVSNDSDPGATPSYAGGFFCRASGSFANNIIANNFAGSATQPNA